MFSPEPPPSDYDLHFQCLGFRVRVHPFFWLAALILGVSGSWKPGEQLDPNAGIDLVIWVVVMFGSILIHELGHAVVIRYFGQNAHIVLYMLGGLAITDASSSGWFNRPVRRTPYTQILISLAGPGAGFVLASATIGLVYAAGGTMQFTTSQFPYLFPVLPEGTSGALDTLVKDLLWLNIIWGMVNLLPVYPLDGGRISQELFQLSDPLNGFARCLWLSIITGVALAAFGGFYLHSVFMALMFASLAASNYMMLQQMGGGGFGGRPW